MYACICNAMSDASVVALRKRCKTKEEFVLELKKLFTKGSCMVCYSGVIEKYEESG